MRTRPASVWGVALAMSLALAGASCAKDATTASQGSPVDTAASTAPSPSPSPTRPVVTPKPTTGEPGPSPAPTALVEGRNFGLIKSVDVSGQTVVFDLAQFLTGDAANEAAAEDGVIKPGESVPDDYYIRNQNPRLRTVPFASNVQIMVVDWSNCCDIIQGQLEPFAHAFTVSEPTGTYRGSASSYWLTIHDGTIVKIEEQYVP